MKPVTVLPESYTLYGDYKPQKFAKGSAILLVASTLFAVLILLNLNHIFPNHSPAVSLAWQSLSVLQRIVLVILFIYSWIYIHECTHAVFFWLFSGHWPQIKLKKWWGIPAAGYIASPGWYYPRGQFVISVLAPLVLLTPLLYILSYWVPPVFVLLVQDCFLLNIAGSLQDGVVGFFAALHPASALITWDGKIYHCQSESDAESSTWSERLRTFLERIVLRVG